MGNIAKGGVVKPGPALRRVHDSKEDGFPGRGPFLRVDSKAMADDCPVKHKSLDI